MIKKTKYPSWRRRLQIVSQALFYLARLCQPGATGDDLGMLIAKLMTQRALLDQLIKELQYIQKQHKKSEDKPPW